MDLNKPLDLHERLQIRSDNAYVEYIGQCRADACLGEQAKLERGTFGAAELAAHRKASELLGRSKGLAEAAELVRATVVRTEGQAK